MNHLCASPRTEPLGSHLPGKVEGAGGRERTCSPTEAAGLGGLPPLREGVSVYFSVSFMVSFLGFYSVFIWGRFRFGFGLILVDFGLISG